MVTITLTCELLDCKQGEAHDHTLPVLGAKHLKPAHGLSLGSCSCKQGGMRKFVLRAQNRLCQSWLLASVHVFKLGSA